MNAVLSVVAGALRGRRYPLDPERAFSIGRSPSTDLQVDDPNVSRVHCRIQFHERRWEIQDLKSSNGTFVNGHRVERQPLAFGDRIRLGGLEIEFVAAHEDWDSPDVTSPGAQLRMVAELPRPESRTLRVRIDDRDSGLLPRAPAVSAQDRAVARLQDQLEAVYQLSSLIHAERDLDTIFTLATETILHVTGASRAAVLMADGEGVPQPRSVRMRRGANIRGEFAVSRTIVEETLRQGISLLSTDAGADERFRAGESISLQGIKSVMCVPVRSGGRNTGAIYVDHTAVLDTFGEADLRLLASIGKQVGVAIERARLISDLQGLFVGVIHTLVATIEAKDPYTKGHSQRVTAYALVLARELGLDREQRQAVELAGLLHDVGKIGIPEAVLNKPDKLCAEEAAVIRTHPAKGADIIRNIANIDRLVSMDRIVSAVRHHHETFDGRGYPDGLAGAEIPLEARLLAVADTYDAITSDRPYRKGGSPERAASEITGNRGTQFDPECADAFEAALAAGRLADAARELDSFRLRRDD